MLFWQAGQSTLGFLNPFIYKNLKLFNDITSGSSEGCKIDGGWYVSRLDVSRFVSFSFAEHCWLIFNAHRPALEGWDAVTGCGTPNYAQLVKVRRRFESTELPECMISKLIAAQLTHRQC